MSSKSRILAIFAHPDRPESPKTGPELRSRWEHSTGRHSALEILALGPSESGRLSDSGPWPEGHGSVGRT